MKISSLAITEAVTTKLLQFPALVDHLHNRDTAFMPLLEAWMKAIETIFRDHNIAESAAIAGLRSKVVATLFAGTSRVAAKKNQLKVAAEILYDLQHIVLNVLEPHAQKIKEAKAILSQLLGLLQQTGMVTYQPGSDFQSFVTRVWHTCTTQEQLKPGAIKILTLVSQADVLRIIAGEIELSNWTNQAALR